MSPTVVEIRVPVAYVHTGNFDDKVRFKELNDQTMTEFIRMHYRGTLIGCGSYSLQDAHENIAKENFDLVAMGQPFIANPDLVSRLKKRRTLKEYDVSMLDSLH